MAFLTNADEDHKEARRNLKAAHEQITRAFKAMMPIAGSLGYVWDSRCREFRETMPSEGIQFLKTNEVKRQRLGEAGKLSYCSFPNFVDPSEDEFMDDLRQRRLQQAPALLGSLRKRLDEPRRSTRCRSSAG